MDMFAGRVVLITGGAGGVGATVCRRWLEAGAHVVAVDVHQESLGRLRETISDKSLLDRLSGVAADLTTESGASSMISAAYDFAGKPADTLIHLAGGFAMGPIDADDAPFVWEKMIALNLHTVFHAYRAAVKSFKPLGRGWIVGMSSRVALQPVAQLSAYAATKAGLIAFSQALAQEVLEDNIHVNVMLASTIDTAANRAAMGESKAKNWVTGDDIADATFYLCSDAAKAVSGATLEIYAKA